MSYLEGTLIYTREVLDRSTGALEMTSVGDWITVTELGQRHGVGRKQVRAILHHMGVLAQEGRSYRLPRSLVERGIGIRHDKPKSGHAFDVISPLGQQLIAEAWDCTHADYEHEVRGGLTGEMRQQLEAFQSRRLNRLGNQEGVSWFLDHFPDASASDIARALEVTPALVTRYQKARDRSLSFWEHFKSKNLPFFPPENVNTRKAYFACLEV